LHSRPASQASAAVLSPALLVREPITPTPNKDDLDTKAKDDIETTSSSIDITNEETMTAGAEKLIHDRVTSALPVTVNIPTS